MILRGYNHGNNGKR